MTYTIETHRTIAGPRHYIYRDGRHIPSGFANKTAAQQKIRYLQVMDQAQAELRSQIKAGRQERNPA